jgi:hypothetical protein
MDIEIRLTAAELSLITLALDDLISGWALDEQRRLARELRDRLYVAEREAIRRQQ